MVRNSVLFLFMLLASVSFGQSVVHPECLPVSIAIRVDTDKADTMNLIIAGGCEGDGKFSFVPKDGIFKFNGLVNRACEGLIFTNTKGKIALDGPAVIRFLIEPGSMSISFAMKNNLPKDIIITGSASEIEKETWQRQFAPVLSFEKKCYEELHDLNKTVEGSLSDDDLKRRLKVITRLEAIKEIKAALAIDFVHKNPASFFSAYLLLMHAPIMSPDSAAWAFLSLTPEVVQSQIGINARNKILKDTDNRQFIEKHTDGVFSKKWVETKDIYDLTAQDRREKQIKFSMFKGKYLFVDFWATWCGPCIKSLPRLHEAVSETSDLPIEYISISIDDLSDYEKWKRFADEYKFPGINVFDRDKFLRTYFKVSLLPTWIIIDPDGEIISRDAYDSDKPLAELIRHLIKGKEVKH